MRLDTSRLLHVKSDYRRGYNVLLLVLMALHTEETHQIGLFLEIFSETSVALMLTNFFFFHPGKPYKYLIVVKTFV